MKAMIFAAGVGSRLKPFTDHHPKALVPVGGVPMLERVIIKLKLAGVNEFVVNVHHFSNQIVEFIKEKGDFGVTIHISDESSMLLDTGGGLLKCRKWLEVGDEPFILHNADILTDAPIAEMADAHVKSQAVATLLTAHRSTSRYLLFDGDRIMRGWTNESTGEVIPKDMDLSGVHKLAFGGVHVASPAIFPALERYAGMKGTEAFSLTPFYIHACASMPILGYLQPCCTYWHDVGKMQSLARAESELQKITQDRR